MSLLLFIWTIKFSPLAAQGKAHLLALNYITSFARNVSVFHLVSQQKAEFLEKHLPMNNILSSTQC